jgi:protein-arginine kinase activator protein McsA
VLYLPASRRSFVALRADIEVLNMTTVCYECGHEFVVVTLSSKFYCKACYLSYLNMIKGEIRETVR